MLLSRPSHPLKGSRIEIAFHAPPITLPPLTNVEVAEASSGSILCMAEPVFSGRRESTIDPNLCRMFLGGCPCAVASTGEGMNLDDG